jgi:hypothetical protein
VAVEQSAFGACVDLHSWAALEPGNCAGAGNQGLKQLSAGVAARGKLRQVHSVRQRDRAPSGAHQRREPLRGAPACAIGVEDAVDGNGISKGRQALNWHVRATNRKRWQVPRDGSQPVEWTLD